MARGTEGSKPAYSSGESDANLTFGDASPDAALREDLALDRLLLAAAVGTVRAEEQDATRGDHLLELVNRM